MLWHSRFDVLVTSIIVLTYMSIGMTEALPFSSLTGGVISRPDTAYIPGNMYVTDTVDISARDGNGSAPAPAPPPPPPPGAPPVPIMFVERFRYDEDKMTGRLNSEDVNLIPNGHTAEHSPPYSRLPERRYRVMNKDNVPLGILKIVNLKSATTESVDPIMKEGEFLKMLGHGMFMWEHEGQGPPWSYAVMYRSIRDQWIYMGGGNSSTELVTMLRTLTDWETRNEEGWNKKIMYLACEQTALRKHEHLANKGIAINDYSLSRWVTDRDCKHWYPLNADPGYKYGPFLDRREHLGARLLKGDIEKYKKTLPIVIRDSFAKKKHKH